MFSINSNNFIQVTKGQKISFIALINDGTRFIPNYLHFQGCELISKTCSTDIRILSLNVDKWIQKQQDSGEYRFYYSEIEESWMLELDKVNLEDYGIDIAVIEGHQLSDDSFILLQYTAGELDKELVYIKFLILERNQNPNYVPLVEKTYYTNGLIKTKRRKDKDPYHQEDDEDIFQNNINSSGSFIITLNEKDTDLSEGRYLYILKYGNKDIETAQPYEITITNKKEFNVINDDYSLRSWTPTSSDSCVTCYSH